MSIKHTLMAFRACKVKGLLFIKVHIYDAQNLKNPYFIVAKVAWGSESFDIFQKK